MQGTNLAGGIDTWRVKSCEKNEREMRDERKKNSGEKDKIRL